MAHARGGCTSAPQTTSACSASASTSTRAAPSRPITWPSAVASATTRAATAPKLLWDGAAAMRRDRATAAAYFEMTVKRGDWTSRAGALARVRRLLDAAGEAGERLDDEVARCCRALTAG